MSTLSTTANNLYALYVQSTKDLAQSLVIKFEEIAKSVNNAVLLKTGVMADEADPASWKYYQNICGQYHVSDTVMEVFSLDAEETIVFSPAMWINHPLTKKAYAFGGTYYNDLLAKHPDQEMLILGILYPADMATALAAKNGTILAYPTHLVEDGETDFLKTLQEWVYAYCHRWITRAYCITDDLYTAAFVAQLTLALLGAISNIRLAACKTNQAHSFHIQQYLRSHGFLDTYLAQMTRRQALDMYRNINYYERNSGFESTFYQLVNVIMQGADLPLYVYEMRHNQESITHDDPLDTEHLQSIGHFKRLPLNESARRFPLPDLTLSQVNALAASATSYNNTYMQDYQEDTDTRMSLSRQAQTPTKFIECAANPVEAAMTTTPAEILLNHWIDWAASDRYPVPIEFTPEGSKTPIRLEHQQAVAIWVYAVHRSMEPEGSTTYEYLTRVPPIRVNRVVRIPVPDVSELLEITDAANLPPNVITGEVGVYTGIYPTAATVPNTIPSLVVFDEVCRSIYKAGMYQYRLYSYLEDSIARGQAQAAATRLYADKIVKLSELQDPLLPDLGITYTTLLQQLGLDFEGFRPIDFFNMAIQILDAATGTLSNNLLDTTDVKKAMMSMFSYLSSYSIIFVTTGDTELRVSLPRPDVRVKYYPGIGENALKFHITPIGILRVGAIESFRATIEIAKIPHDQIDTLVPSFNFKVNGRIVPDKPYRATTLLGRIIPVGVSVFNTDDPDVLFSALTMEQRNALVDVYN